MTRMVGISAVQAALVSVALAVGGVGVGIYTKGAAVEAAVAKEGLKLQKQAEDFKRKLLDKDDAMADHDAKLQAQFDKELNAILRRTGPGGSCLNAADVKRLRNLFARGHR